MTLSPASPWRQVVKPTQIISETFLLYVWPIFFFTPGLRCVVIITVCAHLHLLFFFFCTVLTFPILKSCSLIKPVKRVRKQKWGRASYDKEKTIKKEKKREDSIDEATSPPFPPRSSASRLAPETELQREGNRRRRKKKGRKVRNQRKEDKKKEYFNMTSVFN